MGISSGDDALDAGQGMNDLIGTPRKAAEQEEC